MAFSRILHPVEYSDEGRHAAELALALARSYQADLHVVRVRARRDSTEREATERSRLREFVSQSNPDHATFQSAILYGDPVWAVRGVCPVDCARPHSRRQDGTPWQQPLAGRCVRKRTCERHQMPNAGGTSRAEPPSADTQPMFRNILCPLDSSPPAVAALKQAVDLAKPGSRLTALHVLEGFPQGAVPSASESIRPS